MKIHPRHVLLLALLAISLTGISFAQQFAYRVAANVPYDFYAGDQLFSAGNYIFAVNYGVAQSQLRTRQMAIAR
jgi:hypothetical protein